MPSQVQNYIGYVIGWELTPVLGKSLLVLGLLFVTMTRCFLYKMMAENLPEMNTAHRVQRPWELLSGKTETPL